MPTTNDMTRILLPVLIGACCVVVALTAVQAIAAMVHASPKIGDIVGFSPVKEQPTADGTKLIVHRPDGYGCVLDLNVLRQSGGSLIVEGQITDSPSSFRVHWAGERTSTDASGCGAQADLVLDGRELDLLALSAGGYGAGEKRLPVLVAATGV
jgi:hypothetical protein